MLRLVQKLIAALSIMSRLTHERREEVKASISDLFIDFVAGDAFERGGEERDEGEEAVQVTPETRLPFDSQFVADASESVVRRETGRSDESASSASVISTGVTASAITASISMSS